MPELSLHRSTIWGFQVRCESSTSSSCFVWFLIVSSTNAKSLFLCLEKFLRTVSHFKHSFEGQSFFAIFRTIFALSESCSIDLFERVITYITVWQAFCRLSVRSFVSRMNRSASRSRWYFSLHINEEFWLSFFYSVVIVRIFLRCLSSFR